MKSLPQHRRYTDEIDRRHCDGLIGVIGTNAEYDALHSSDPLVLQLEDGPGTNSPDSLTDMEM